MTQKEEIKELESALRTIMNPLRDYDLELEAEIMIDDGWHKQIEAEWVKMEYSNDYKCSHCTYIHCDGEELRRNLQHFLYCGHCGAKMELKEK